MEGGACGSRVGEICPQCCLAYLGRAHGKIDGQQGQHRGEQQRQEQAAPARCQPVSSGRGAGRSRHYSSFRRLVAVSAAEVWGYSFTMRCRLALAPAMSLTSIWLAAMTSRASGARGSVGLAWTISFKPWMAPLKSLLA